MDNRVITTSILGLLVGTLLLLLPQASFAEDIICPAVYPCLEGGLVMEEFQSGPCGERFKAQCAQDELNRVNELLAICESSSEFNEQKYLELQEAYLSLKRSYSRKMRRLRRLRSSYRGLKSPK